MAGLILTPVVGWTLGTFVGGAATQLMPQKLSSAMGIAFVWYVYCHYHSSGQRTKKCAVHGDFGNRSKCCLFQSPVLKHLSGGWAIILITILVSGIAAWLFPRNEGGECRVSTKYIIVSMFVMALTTYVIRMLPMAIFRKRSMTNEYSRFCITCPMRCFRR